MHTCNVAVILLSPRISALINKLGSKCICRVSKCFPVFSSQAAMDCWSVDGVVHVCCLSPLQMSVTSHWVSLVTTTSTKATTCHYHLWHHSDLDGHCDVIRDQWLTRAGLLRHKWSPRHIIGLQSTGRRRTQQNEERCQWWTTLAQRMAGHTHPVVGRPL